MKPILRDVCCTFLPGKYPNGVPVPSLYNEVYRHWKTIWGDIFTKAGSPASLNAENFLRQDAIIVLHRKEEIVGLLTSSFFNLSASPIFDHPYLRPFSEDLVQKLKNDGRGMVCTAEYLSVHPEFRKSLVGVSLFEVLIGLGLKMVFKLDAKMMLATTVRPAKVYECGPRFGWVEAGTIQKYGLDCLLHFITPELAHSNTEPDVAELVEEYWSRRNDSTGLTTGADVIQLAPKKKPAAAA
jgi:hypothetical protein